MVVMCVVCVCVSVGGDLDEGEVRSVLFAVVSFVDVCCDFLACCSDDAIGFKTEVSV